MFLMRSYLHDLDIDGATSFARHGASSDLTVYFYAVISTSSGRHGAVVLASQGVAKCTKDIFYMVVLNID